MWFFMMIAMMLPSVIPFVIMFQKINEERKKLQYQYFATFNFALSYIAVWGLFSFFATMIHLILKNSNILSDFSFLFGEAGTKGHLFYNQLGKLNDKAEFELNLQNVNIGKKIQLVL